jgi:hypothetical protein
MRLIASPANQKVIRTIQSYPVSTIAEETFTPGKNLARADVLVDFDPRFSGNSPGFFLICLLMNEFHEAVLVVVHPLINGPDIVRRNP